jgi:hypothetical protein
MVKRMAILKDTRNNFAFVMAELKRLELLDKDSKGKA